MPAKRPARPDPSTDALRAVRKVTDIGPMRGEDLLRSPKLKAKLRAAKKSSGFGK